MIALGTMRATLALLLILAGCTAAAPPRLPPPGTEAETQPGPASDSFTMPDGARLPVRVWLPEGAPRAIILALHGMNDSRDAWELPAPAFTAAGIALFAPDQRGFGEAPSRSLWPGATRLVADARAMTALLRARYPGTPLVLMGESMGGAVAMALQASDRPADIDRLVLLAPAVWHRGEMNPAMRAALWLGATLAPDYAVGAGQVPITITPSDNQAAMRRLARDPLTLHRTRLASIAGLVDLMDTAQAAAPRQRTPTLILYGGHDDLVPQAPMRDAWRELPPAVRRAFYPDLHHLLLRDRGRTAPIADILAFIDAPTAPLPSGADHHAATWQTTANS